ncbi:hypothetical protein NDU88_000748, partial [Pleurodeles waltl]
REQHMQHLWHIQDKHTALTLYNTWRSLYTRSSRGGTPSRESSTCSILGTYRINT